MRSTLDSILSDEEGLIGDSQGEEDDREWSGSGSDGVSPDASDQDSDWESHLSDPFYTDYTD